MSEQAKAYLAKHQIPQVIENLASMLIKETPEKPLDAMSQWISLHGGVGTDVYDLKTKARIPAFVPTPVQVEAGKAYYWCTCGYSKNQPFCDGSHVKANEKNGTKFAPMPYNATESTTVYFCGCKSTKNPPMCDGTHASLHKIKLNVFAVSPNAMAVLCFLRDANIPVEVTTLNPGDHKKEEFLQKYPLGQVPTITDPGAGPNGTDFHTYESCSILRYLCDKYRLGAPWYPADPVERNRVDRMLDWRQTAFYGPLSKMCYPFLGLLPKVDSEIEQATTAFTANCELFTSKLLEGKKFVGGDHPCIADYNIAIPLAIVAANKAYQLSPGMQAYFNHFKEASANFEDVMGTVNAFVAGAGISEAK